MRPIIQERLGAVKKQFKTKFDILTPKFLAEVAKEGTRLLHITADLYERDKLWVEGTNGVAEEIPLRHLEQMLSKIAPYGLPIDVVDIAMPNSINIGRVFKA